MTLKVAKREWPRIPVSAIVEKLVYGGDGLARVNGQVLLAPFVLPGETIETIAEPGKGNALRASDLRIINQAAQRITPQCEYFGVCGGCHYQHADYAFQLAQKLEILRETLRRLGGIAFEGDVPTRSSAPWHYRNRIQLHCRDRRIGFLHRKSHELCAIDHCPISSPALNEAIKKMHVAIRDPRWPEFLQSFELFTDEDSIQLQVSESLRPLAARFFDWIDEVLACISRAPIVYAVAGNSYRVSRGSFFQVNRFLLDDLVHEVVGQIGGRRAIDLYAGVGLFSLPLARRFDYVEAVERGVAAHADLAFNTSESAGTISTHKVSTEEFLRGTDYDVDLVVADPPRAGLRKEATAELVRIRAHRLIIVSCDPSTLARDLAALLTAYRIERLTMIDLFPQTFHFETVAHLIAT